MAAGSWSIHPQRARWPSGGGLVRGLAMIYLLMLLVLPLAVLIVDGLADGPQALLRAIWQPAARHALWLTLWTAALMALINAVMGTLTAYVLVRYHFPGKALVNAVVDLPFAIPTLVTGVMLATLYGPQSALGGWLAQRLGWQIIYAPSGIVLALLFVSLPFVVRTVQPVLEALEREEEEAAATLGAGAWTSFRRVVLPKLWLPITGGALLSFARAVGEFGAIVIVAGNIPLRTQTAAVYVFGEVESANRRGASAVSLVLVALAFGLVLLVDQLQRRQARAS